MLLVYLFAVVANQQVVVNAPDGSYAIRVQGLSPSLLRVERSKGTRNNSFENRPTFFAVNRSWSGVELTANGTTVSSAYYSVHIAFAKDAETKEVENCSRYQSSADAECDGPCEHFRTKKNHGSYTVKSQDECCAKCDADASCNNWVFGAPSAKPAANCWLLTKIIGSRKHNGRVLGGNLSFPPPVPPISSPVVTIFDHEGKQIFSNSLRKISSQPQLPSPSVPFDIWTVRDSPRFVPPKWGATPVPDGTPPLGPLAPTSGFDTFSMDTPDAYFFLPSAQKAQKHHSRGRAGVASGSSGSTAYEHLRQELIFLTGPVPGGVEAMPPHSFFFFFFCCCSLCNCF